MKKKSKLEQLEIDYESLMCQVKAKDLELRQLKETIKQNKSFYASKITQLDEHISYLEKYLVEARPKEITSSTVKSQNQVNPAKAEEKQLDIHSSDILEGNKQQKRANQSRALVLSSLANNPATLAVPKVQHPQPHETKKVKYMEANTFFNKLYDKKEEPIVTNKYTQTEFTATKNISSPSESEPAPIKHNSVFQNALQVYTDSHSKEKGILHCSKENPEIKERLVKDNALFKIDPDLDLELLNKYIAQELKMHKQAKCKNQDTSVNTKDFKDNQYSGIHDQVVPISPTYTTPNTPVIDKLLPSDDYTYISASELQDLHDQIELHQMTIVTLEGIVEELSARLPINDGLLWDSEGESSPSTVFSQEQRYNQAPKVVFPTIYSICTSVIKGEVNRFRKRFNI
ncbi:hypothetical protein HK103_005067 [Boothiomyces macroporosus]|uniref:Uncharacterized protein n=1 Tax=Boothiomyces macroporosus TaxID=261099 RepID=A0AAD5Y3N7_9FUNG|nr:hypothetical protein HK103_005067 [Boothiomyces macroporosus]